MSESALSEDDAGETILALSGEIDLATADAAAERGIEALESAQDELVIDLGDVTFVDSAGLTALVRIRKTALGDGKRVLVISAQPYLQRAFELTGLANAFGMTAARTDAP